MGQDVEKLILSTKDSAEFDRDLLRDPCLTTVSHVKRNHTRGSSDINLYLQAVLDQSVKSTQLDTHDFHVNHGLVGYGIQVTGDLKVYQHLWQN